MSKGKNLDAFGQEIYFFYNSIHDGEVRSFLIGEMFFQFLR